MHVALNRARSYERFWERVQLELEKARRQDRRFVLARLRFDPDTVGGEQLGTALAQGLRYEDAILVDELRPDEVLVLLAECDGSVMWHVLHRLEQRYAAHWLRAIAAVVFPADGFTRDTLVKTLYAPDASIAAAPGLQREQPPVEPDVLRGM